MQRRWQAQPDMAMDTPQGPIEVVSQESLSNAVYDGVVMVHRAGGTLSLVVVRAPTGLPGEMVTTRAIVEWKDRTDAKAQPELANPFDEAVDVATPTAVESEPPGPVREPAAAQPLESIGDGLDQPSVKVDESSIPEQLRG